jgi:hypothetical protein
MSSTEHPPDMPAPKTIESVNSLVGAMMEFHVSICMLAALEKHRLITH